MWRHYETKTNELSPVFYIRKKCPPTCTESDFWASRRRQLVQVDRLVSYPLVLFLLDMLSSMWGSILSANYIKTLYPKVSDPFWIWFLKKSILQGAFLQSLKNGSVRTQKWLSTSSLIISSITTHRYTTHLPHCISTNFSTSKPFLKCKVWTNSDATRVSSILFMGVRECEWFMILRYFWYLFHGGKYTTSRSFTKFAVRTLCVAF